MTYPSDQGAASGAIPVWVAGAPANATGRTVKSKSGTAGTASGILLAAGSATNWVTIQCADATGILYVSANTPATANDIALGPGQSLTLPFAVANAIYGIGSAATVKYAIIYS